AVACLRGADQLLGAHLRGGQEDRPARRDQRTVLHHPLPLLQLTDPVGISPGHSSFVGQAASLASACGQLAPRVDGFNSFREFSTVRSRKEHPAERVDYTQAQAARLLYEEARDATTLSFCPVLWTGWDRAVGPRRSGAGAVSSRHQQGADVARR